jgi:hypothetical protein
MKPFFNNITSFFWAKSAENFRGIWRIFGQAKGQLISKCPFGVFKSPKKPTKYL